MFAGDSTFMLFIDVFSMAALRGKPGRTGCYLAKDIGFIRCTLNIGLIESDIVFFGNMCLVQGKKQRGIKFFS